MKYKSYTGNKKHGFGVTDFEELDELGNIYGIWMFFYMYRLDARRNSRYDIDLSLYADGKLWGYADPEIRRYDVSNLGDDDVLYISERKKKYLRYETVEKKPVLFCTFNEEGTFCLMVRGRDLIGMEPVLTVNKRNKDGELSYHVPMSRVRKFRIERKNDWY